MTGQFDPLHEDQYMPDPETVYYVQDIALGYADVSGYSISGGSKETTVAVTFAAAKDHGNGLIEAPSMTLCFKPQTLGAMLMGLIGTSWHLTHQENGDQYDIFLRAFWNSYLKTGPEAAQAWNWLCTPLSKHVIGPDGSQHFRCAACRMVTTGADSCVICGGRSSWGPEMAPESPADGPATAAAADHTGDAPEAQQ